MKSFTLKGKVYTRQGFKKGTFRVDKYGFKEIEAGSYDFEGTLIPSPLNSHTHMGDSFISEEPIGTLSEIVGPGGFKMKHLNHASDEEISRGIMRTINFMKNIGTLGFIDFREQGLRGIKLIPEFKGINGVFLSRPSDIQEADILADMSHGFAMSSITDNDFNFLLQLREVAIRKKKLFSVHFSENIREDIEKLAKLNPDFIVHGIEATDEDLKMISKLGIYCVITPRSNIFYGKEPDYARFLINGVKVLLGTDNVFTTEPDIFTEMDYLYRYQRSRNRLSPEDIMRAAIWNPRDFLTEKGINFSLERYMVFFDDISEFEMITRAHIYDYVVVDIESKK